MSSTSDSESENLARIRDSIDIDLLNDDLFNGQLKANNTQSSATQRSLRFQKTEDDNWIQTTPAFRAYVAKLLVKQLDAALIRDLVHFSTNSTTTPKAVVKNRVKLFRTSIKCIKIDECALKVPTKRCKSVPELNYDELENKCRLVAVNGLDILNKTEIKAWCTRSKAPVVRCVKLKDGSLVEKCTFV